MLNFFRLTIFIFIGIQASAQINFEKGYFIDNSGKRVDCLIRNVDWKDNPTSFDYKFSVDAESNSKTVQEVEEFGIESQFKFVKSLVKINRSTDLAGRLEQDSKVIYSEETLFLRALVEGNANLYYYEDGNLRRFFFSTANQATVQLAYKRFRNPDFSIGENNGYRQQLLNAFKCDGVKKSVISKLLYKRDPLVKIFGNFNQCVDSTWIAPKSEKSGFVFDVSVKTGFNSSSLYVSTGKAEFSKKTSLKFGAELAIILPFNRNKWALLLESSYRSYKNNTSEASFGNIPVSALVDYTSIEIAVGARHSLFLSENNQVFFSGYLLNDIPINSFYQVGSKLDIIPQGNFAIGFGYKFQNQISMEFRYHFNREIFRLKNTTSEFRNISVIFGYTLF